MPRPTLSLLVGGALALALGSEASGAEPTRKAVAETVAARVQSDYVFESQAAAAARLVRKRASSGAYDKAADNKAFADAVTADLYSVTKDKHLVVRYRA